MWLAVCRACDLANDQVTSEGPPTLKMMVDPAVPHRTSGQIPYCAFMTDFKISRNVNMQIKYVNTGDLWSPIHYGILLNHERKKKSNLAFCTMQKEGVMQGLSEGKRQVSCGCSHSCVGCRDAT